MSEIRLSRDAASHIGTLTIDRPAKANAFSWAMAKALSDGIDALERDDDIKVIVIEAAGDDLSVGIDVTELDAVYPDDGRKVPSQRARLAVHHEYWWGPSGLYNRLLNCRKVTLTSAKGRCFGIGFYLSLYADLVIAADDARFSQPRWRHVGVDGDISMLVAAVGLKRASELMYCDAVWTARQAVDYGLIDEAVPNSELSRSTAELAKACAMIMRDGIATEKQVVSAALAKMQIGTGFAAASVIGGWASNIHHRAGEFNFYRELREHGPRVAMEKSEAFHRQGVAANTKQNP